MGGDGGCMAYRTELVRTKKKKERLARDVQNAARWRYCALSQQPLQDPIVACPLGRLFNKEALIRAMIDKTISQIENAKHITSIKDVKELKLTKNPDIERLAGSSTEKSDVYHDPNVSQFICPVVGLGMNGKYRFCVIWSCGCVMSERSLREIKSEVCQKCGEKYDEKDILVLYGTDEEVESYRQKFEALKDAQKVEKANKKAGKNVQISNMAADKNPPLLGKRVHKTEEEKNMAASTSSTTSKKQDLERKTSETTQNKKIATKKEEKEKAERSVQKDNSKSDVFKSLFTTSEEAKKRPTSHWVTYNPLYY